ncbi:MAG: DUF111 family protein, partial [Coriobacteriia bacterium]|nr:DUF111 family protein [Coriobacteriia bacterium]
MRIAHLDVAATGASGDKLLGALLDAGWPLERLRALVAGLRLDGVSVEAVRGQRGGVRGTTV